MVHIVQYREIQRNDASLKDDQRKDGERVRICEAERMRPFHLVEHGRIVVVWIVLVRTALTLPAAHHGGTIR